jgi:hypothetical protein
MTLKLTPAELSAQATGLTKELSIILGEQSIPLPNENSDTHDTAGFLRHSLACCCRKMQDRAAIFWPEFWRFYFTDVTLSILEKCIDYVNRTSEYPFSNIYFQISTHLVTSTMYSVSNFFSLHNVFHLFPSSSFSAFFCTVIIRSWILCQGVLWYVTYLKLEIRNTFYDVFIK